MEIFREVRIFTLLIILKQHKTRKDDKRDFSCSNFIELGIDIA
jgi:hypothetical protein